MISIDLINNHYITGHHDFTMLKKGPVNFEAEGGGIFDAQLALMAMACSHLAAGFGTSMGTGEVTLW